MVLLIAIVTLALVFDYTNGFHDTANAIATSVSTRALSPRVAVLMAAGLNLLGALISTSVAKTVGKGIVNTDLVTLAARARGRSSAPWCGTSRPGTSASRPARPRRCSAASSAR